MGGIIFILAAALCVFTGIYGMASGDFSHLLVLALSILFGAIGFYDDYIKVKKKRNLGLTSIQKLILQILASAVFLVAMYLTGNCHNDLYVPFVKESVCTVPVWLYIPCSVFIIVGCVNAVNLTDGIDGLAAGVTTPVMIFFIITASMAQKSGLVMFPAALTGGLVGFLMYNFHPAKVFMGDTGSLFLGGAVVGMAYALDMPLILVLIGLIYIIETLSDIIQVGYFKISHGKRVFKMAPIHHHFEMCGWSEIKIWVVFVGITVVMCILAFFGVKSWF